MREEIGSPVVISRERVAAPTRAQGLRLLPLSNLDLVMPFTHASFVICYEKPGNRTREPFASAAAATLKRSLSQLLVTYYSFAGEVVVNAQGEPELLCNNRGVDFAEARSGFGLGDLPLCDTDAGWGRMLPAMWDDHGALSVQVTELNCGRLVIGILFDHRFADTYSISMFLTAWQEVAHQRPLPFVPHFHRSLLSPRKPLQQDSSNIDEFYFAVSKINNDIGPATSRHRARRFYYIAAEEMSELQALASAGGRTVSKSEAFTAYIWKMVGAEATSQGITKTCRMGRAVEGRSRLGGSGGKKRAIATMAAYVGNVSSFSCSSLGVEELRVAHLSELVDVLRRDLQNLTTEEHFLTLIDQVEARRPEAVASRICSEVVDGGSSLLVMWGPHLAALKADFGWGTPIYGSLWSSSHFVKAGIVMVTPSLSKKGDWIVFMELESGLYEALEAKARSVLHPLAFDDLRSAGSTSRTKQPQCLEAKL